MTKLMAAATGVFLLAGCASHAHDQGPHNASAGSIEKRASRATY